MTDEERRSLAEQLDANPLWHEILETIEAEAVEALVYANTETDRLEAQHRVRAARAFRQNCQDHLGNNRAQKGSFA